ncbi:MAG: glycerol-3-phosphate dehydrogenase [Rhodospirillales bacterium]|jgi:glycerol-3-phosphate dehydrogenase|nr:glycerol-3-phosphate dehydrogenase [Rhodospirillales bacterium]
MQDNPIFDLLVIGGGINGAGIACDAAGRGLSVLLCEQGDLAGATSSASSKLIHGGLRYLEYGEFRLVREALLEREVLLAKAPHIIWPLRFVLPHQMTARPAWLIRTGLFIYDYLGRNQQLPDSQGIDLRRHPAGKPLKKSIRKGFVYSDCWTDDARLVVLNAMAAAERGARIRTRTRVASARRVDGVWEVGLADGADGQQETVRARLVVNTAGPWVRAFLDDVAHIPSASRVRLVKGSHLVVPRLHDGDEAFILQNVDKRIVFVLPYEGRFSLIGTTDVPFTGDPAEVTMDAGEADYLCAAVNRYFAKPISPADIVWSYAGVRPLYDDASDNPSAVTREYVLELDLADGEAPLLSVFGGKITTYRSLAEHVMDKIRRFFPAMGEAWTWSAPLPGGDIPGASFTHLTDDLARAYPHLDPALLGAVARRHGTRTYRILGDAKQASDLGVDFGAALTAREIDYLMAEEWARAPDDVLWRRTKCGLHMTETGRQAVAGYMANNRSAKSVNTPSTPQANNDSPKARSFTV